MGFELVLVEEAKPEAEHLLVVERLLDDREAEVERDRHRAKHRHHDAGAEADTDAIAAEAHVALHGARIAERDSVEIIVGQERDLQLHAIEEQEVATHLVADHIRTDAAELEAAQAAKTAGIEALEHRRVGAG